MNIYNFKVNDNQNNVVDLSIYSGKILLIINTATKCGFTPQYKYFQSLYERFKENSFEILDFPCDQFFHQAPGSDSEINSFCELKYHTTFKRFAKIDVNGKNESPLYTFLKSKKSGLFSSKIKWNFTKFLIDRNGEVLRRFSPATSPKKIEKIIASLINNK